MNLGEVIRNTAGWLRGAQDECGIVVSCRARLARNLASMPFAANATDADRAQVLQRVREAACKSAQLERATFLQMESLGQNERTVLVERHLISPALAEGSGPRGVIFARDESLSVMVNEEDHVRLQAVLPGMQMKAAWERVNALDDELGAMLDYAHHQRWGYLTACPTNVGTGLRVSVLIHLPGLVLSDEMERVVRGLMQLSCSVRGLYGEGTNALGNLFQLSNQVTLGRSEEELVESVSRVAQQLIVSEKDTHERLMSEVRSQVEDKVWRAYGLLCHARVLSTQEFMSLLSAVRLGYTLRLIDSLPSGFMNQLMVATQPAHLQAESGRELTAEERDVRRAALVRQRLAELQRNASGTAPGT